MGLIFLAGVILGLSLSTTNITLYQQCLQNPTLCPTNSTIFSPPSQTYGGSWYNPIISTWSGYIKGLTWNSRSGKMYFAFLGIPYAEVQLRFEISRPIQKWNGVLDATRFRPVCLQLNPVTRVPVGAEHCTFLNVYTPKISTTQLMPVMVWIHGESWQRGGADQINPKNFMDHEVVLVSISYRLNAFGFLSTGDDEVPGNMGLHDQRNALAWVRQNIQSFGGDPQQITLLGNEAGASSIHIHMISPLSQGMFQQAITQSGSALCPWAIQRNPVTKTRKLAELLNCNTTNSKAMINCFRSKSDRDIIQAQTGFGINGWPLSEPQLVFGPVVEQVSTSFLPVYLPEEPRNLILKGQVMIIPWIIGFTEDEGRFYTYPIVTDKTATGQANSNWRQVAPISFFYDEQAAKDDTSNKIRSFYMGNRAFDLQSITNYSNMYSDRLYKSCILETINAHSGISTIFPYVFKFKGDFSYADGISRQEAPDYNKPVPSHNDELHYLFNWKGSPESSPWSSSYEFSKKLVNLWVSFATNGYPAATWGTTRTWKPASGGGFDWYGLDYDSQSITLSKEGVDRINFWGSLSIL